MGAVGGRHGIPEADHAGRPGTPSRRAPPGRAGRATRARASVVLRPRRDRRALVAVLDEGLTTFAESTSMRALFGDGTALPGAGPRRSPRTLTCVDLGRRGHDRRVAACWEFRTPQNRGAGLCAHRHDPRDARARVRTRIEGLGTRSLRATVSVRSSEPEAPRRRGSRSHGR